MALALRLWNTLQVSCCSLLRVRCSVLRVCCSVLECRVVCWDVAYETRCRCRVAVCCACVAACCVCVAVWWSVVQCVETSPMNETRCETRCKYRIAVFCTYVAVWCRVVRCGVVCCDCVSGHVADILLQWVAVSCSELQWVAVSCSCSKLQLQWVVVCCSTMDEFSLSCSCSCSKLQLHWVTMSCAELQYDGWVLFDLWLSSLWSMWFVYACMHGCIHTYMYTHKYTETYTSRTCMQKWNEYIHANMHASKMRIHTCVNSYGVATISRLLKIISLLCKRAL